MRNAEVIRQWQILREIESRRVGVTIHELATTVKVSTRTIRRDLQALQEAGFSIYDEGEENETKRWRLDAQPFRAVQEGLSVADVAALYLSRSIATSLSGWPLADELGAALAKIERALNPRMREFLATLPQVISTKKAPRARQESGRLIDVTRRLFEAVRDRRVVEMRYFSAQSHRAKSYTRRALPPHARAGRRVPHRVGARVRRVPHVRGRAHRAPLGVRRHVPQNARSARRRLRQLDGRLLRAGGANRSRVRRAHRALRRWPRLARVSAGHRARGRRRSADAPGVE